jgi:hypothetical protein
VTNSIFKSDRTFVVFSYSASHGLLLLRSPKANPTPTRVDVLIQDVRAIEIRSWFDGIEILEVQSDYLREFRSNPIEMLESGNRVYALRGNGWQGFIAGGIVSTHEDEGEFSAPSKLMGNELKW